MKSISPSPSRVLAAFLVAGLFGAFSASAQTITTTIYSDTFSRAGTFAGSAPDVGTGNWTSTGAPTLDGTKVTATSIQSYLPFSPVSGATYTLSVNLTTVTSGGQWTGFGFASSTSGDTAHFHTAFTPAPWMMLRGDNGLDLFGGPGGTNSQTSPGVTGPGVQGSVYSIILNTTASQWTYSYSGPGINSTPVYTFSTNPTITQVGFGTISGVTGNFDNFTLTQTSAIPEPSTYAALAGLAAFGLVCVRRRRAGLGMQDRAA
jgi:hypothetical protein